MYNYLEVDRMKNKNGYTVIDLVIVIAVLGVITFLTISKVSYALSDDKSEVYKLEVKLIETQAKAYGNTIKEELKNESKTITVNNLIADKFLQPDDDNGKIKDPRDDAKTLNDKKIKLSYNAELDEVQVKYMDK